LLYIVDDAASFLSTNHHTPKHIESLHDRPVLPKQTLDKDIPRWSFLYVSHVRVWRLITHDPIPMPTLDYCSTDQPISYFIVVSFTFVLSQ
jgi:hypothetical protein